MSVSTAVLPIARGTTYFDGGTTDATSAEKLLGTTRTVNDTENGTGREVVLQLVRNESGSTLAAGRPVLYTAGEQGLSISGYGSPSQPLYAGVVDDAYGSATIAANDVFWIVKSGVVDTNGQTDQTYPKMADLIGHEFGAFKVSDDFKEYVSADVWTTVATDSGAVALTDAFGGVISVTASDGSVADNDECYIHGTKKMFLFSANNSIHMYGRLKLTEANTDDANILFGLCSAAVADSLTDNGAGPPGTYSGVCFFKVDGGTVWQAEASLSTTQTTDTSAGAFVSGSYADLVIDVYSTSATSATAKFYVNGTEGASITFTYTSAVEMHPIVGVKNGGANNEVLYIDRVLVVQRRS